MVPVDEKAVPFFKAGKELRDRLNREPADLRQHASRSRGGFGIRFTVRSGLLFRLGGAV